MHGWSQEELAEKIDVNLSFVGQLERGIKTARLTTLKRIADVFGIKMADFFGERAVNLYKPLPMERKIINLIRNCSPGEQKILYQTLKHISRQKRKFRK